MSSPGAFFLPAGTTSTTAATPPRSASSSPSSAAAATPRRAALEHERVEPPSLAANYSSIVCFSTPARARRARKYSSSSPPLLQVFLVLYAMTAYYFANKMNRLIILMGPVASALSGIAMGMTLDWIVRRVWGVAKALEDLGSKPKEEEKAEEKKAEEPAAAGTPGKAGMSKSASGSGSAASLAKAAAKKDGKKKQQSSEFSLSHLREVMIGKPAAAAQKVLDKPAARVFQALFALALVYLSPARIQEFWNWSHMLAHQMSSPSVVFKAQLHSGEVIIVTDYLDAYLWLRENTPEDARVLAWWDYGYQITGIANRTSLADGNTWNLEHIALLGRCLTSPEPKSHRIVRHLADYVLVWSGGGGDDLAKSPHMARIGTSVFHDICGTKDPMCHGFGFLDQQGTPTRSMAVRANVREARGRERDEKGKRLSLLTQLSASSPFPSTTHSPRRLAFLSPAAKHALPHDDEQPPAGRLHQQHPLGGARSLCSEPSQPQPFLPSVLPRPSCFLERLSRPLPLPKLPAPPPAKRTTGGVHVQVPQGPHLQGEERVQEEQGVPRGPVQPQVRRAGVVVLPGGVPAGGEAAAAGADAREALSGRGCGGAGVRGARARRAAERRRRRRAWAWRAACCAVQQRPVAACRGEG